MGNSQSSKSEKIVQGQQFHRNNHPNFESAQIVTRQNQTYLLKIKIPVHSKSDVLEWEKKLADISKNINTSLLLPVSHNFDKEGLCGSGGMLSVYFQNFSYLMTDQIKNRKLVEKYFTQAELWYLLFTILSGAKFFAQKNLKLGDIRPQNIFVNDDGIVKLFNIYSLPNQETNYYKTSVNKIITYLAPEQIDELSHNENKIIQKINQQAFSIGLTILDAGLLQNLKGLYNINKRSFDIVGLSKIIERWNNSEYSRCLKQFVKNFLELDCKKRKSIIEAHNELLPHKQDIQSLTPFQLKKYQKTDFMKNINTNTYETQKPVIQQTTQVIYTPYFQQNLPTPYYNQDNQIQVQYNPQTKTINQNIQSNKQYVYGNNNIPSYTYPYNYNSFIPVSNPPTNYQKNNQVVSQRQTVTSNTTNTTNIRLDNTIQIQSQLMIPDGSSKQLVSVLQIKEFKTPIKLDSEQQKIEKLDLNNLRQVNSIISTEEKTKI